MFHSIHPVSNTEPLYVLSKEAMPVFQTERLLVKQMEPKDAPWFTELLSDPAIIDPIPQPEWSGQEIAHKFESFINYSEDPLSEEKVIWGVFEKDATELIGLCALLTNEDRDREIGYRFRKKYWGKGYATELTRHLIDFCFGELHLDRITADVNITNTRSVKVLEKFMTPLEEFYNDRDRCTDLRYVLHRENWKSKK